MTPEQEQKAADLWNKGHAPNQIARALGISADEGHATVVAVLRRMDLDRGTRPQAGPAAVPTPPVGRWKRSRVPSR